MADARRVDPEHPSRAFALKPIWRGLNDASGENFVWSTPVVSVVVERGERHARTKANSLAGLGGRIVGVREAKNLAEDSVEVGSNPACFVAHELPLVLAAQRIAAQLRPPVVLPSVDRRTPASQASSRAAAGRGTPTGNPSRRPSAAAVC